MSHTSHSRSGQRGPALTVPPDNELPEEQLVDEIVEQSMDSSYDGLSEIETPILERTSTKMQNYYDSLLNNTDWNVNNLRVQPGDPQFILWFICSSYFPLICGCIGPLSNLLSVAAVICNWKQDRITGKPAGADEVWCYTVNSISMACGLAANISLLLNFRRKLAYNKAQLISIAGWLVASLMLLVLVVIYHVRFITEQHYNQFTYSYGFWFAVYTVVLHFANFVLLSLNQLGVLLHQYTPAFNIDGVQNTLMLQSMFFVVWLMWGAGMFTALLHVSYGEALYFAIVTILTIGLGDFVPSTSAAQALTLLWCIVGLVTFGLIISTIRELVMFSSESTFYWHRVQFFRNIELQNLPADLSPEDSFNRMKHVNRRALSYEKLFSTMTIVVSWLVFWLLGSLLFTVYEGWPYHLSCYFSFLCFVTIGYGVPSPATSGGRTFFCVWSIAAIPIMTILVMNISDFIFGSLSTIQNFSVHRRDPDPAFDGSHPMMDVLQAFSQSKKLNTVDFFNTQEYIRTIQMARDLYNYPDEGKPVRFHYQPHKVAQMLKKIDPGFDDQQFLQTFYNTIQEKDTDGDSVIRTRFRKKKDPVLTHIGELQQIVTQLRKASFLANTKPDFKYTYTDWETFLHLTGGDTTNSEFWLSEKSPFGFPNDEPLYFTYHLQHSLEKKLQELALTYDNQ
ncbi:hypothetical protein OGAPHI_000796 [Ogataea philodendri]|uniref:Potassium channel domain-containing protein n=1 Tax=Ogataea philodendri TaxID=1378263 RepID=A0A9P8PGB3_9ASCO|nr:uncharacterized protein OGAPHI_000796 [Ogataea philodendri]KAH3671085.1 hypothetical protein OGAPHI_000796 [Ogataea philodendri]